MGASIFGVIAIPIRLGIEFIHRKFIDSKMILTNVGFDYDNYLAKPSGGILIEKSSMDINGGRRRGR